MTNYAGNDRFTYYKFFQKTKNICQYDFIGSFPLYKFFIRCCIKCVQIISSNQLDQSSRLHHKKGRRQTVEKKNYKRLFPILVI